MITLHEKTFICPIDVSLSFINGKWKVLILGHLHRFQKSSFSHLREQMPGISEKMLTQQLKDLEKDLLIVKHVLSAKPYRVEYTLTPLGQSLSPVTEFLSQWGIRYLKDNGIDYIKDQHLYK